MNQVIFNRTYGSEIGNLGMPSGAPAWSALRGGVQFLSGEVTPPTQAKFDNSPPWSVAGILKNFWAAIYIPVLRRTSQPISWPPVTLTLLKNGSPTSLVVTLPAGGAGSAGVSGLDVTHTVLVAPGDVLTLERIGQPLPVLNGVGAHFLWSMSFEPTANDESCYVFPDNAGAPTFAPFAAGLWNSGGLWNVASSVGNFSVVPCGGDVFRSDVQILVPTGLSGSRTFVIEVNGVLQDGTNGTPDTTLVFNDNTTTGRTASFTLPVSVLDRVAMLHTPAGTPAASTAVFSTGFRPTTPGQYAYCTDQGNANASSTVVDYFGSGRGGALQTTPWAPTPPGAPPADGEVFLSLPGGVDTFSLSGFILTIDLSPGTGKSYTTTVRKNLSTAAAAPQITLSNAEVSGQTNLGGLTFTAPTDLLDVQTFPMGSPNPTHWNWTFLLTSPIAPPSESGCPTEGVGCILDLPAC